MSTDTTTQTDDTTGHTTDAGDGVVEPTSHRHLDAGWRRRALVDEVHDALVRRPRRLTPRWLYDDRIDGMTRELADAGLAVEHVWTDADADVAVFLARG